MSIDGHCRFPLQTRCCPVCREGFELGGHSSPDGPGMDHSCPDQLTASTVPATSATQPKTVSHDDGHTDRPGTRVHVAPPLASARPRCRRLEQIAPMEGVCCPSRWAKLTIECRAQPDYFFLPWVLPEILVSWVFAAQEWWTRAAGGRRWSSLATVERPRTAQGRPSSSV